MNLLLIDDHPLFGVGFAHALTQAAPDIAVRTAATVDEGLAQAAAWPALDIVLVDYRLGETSGLDGLRRFGERFPCVARVLISGDEDAALVARARAAGASGFLGKSASIAALLAALQRVARGDTVLGEPGAQPGGCPTARQMEVLALIAQGQPNKGIARALGIAERTVKLHVTALLDAVGARNRTHLLVRAREQGLL
ncbi:response regulator transcription factor [Roseateles asaccharophilus]|uniref:DNA-binding NarL/FixJ family response regulator n=1 Tax=Roseateles asaccharophilus TaxID=582607 RepID=A0ABU2A7G4_9BURK|nr:response regulator transcription factor [Roseateles asaccharophilus]MDR7333070.1 DNA-binding NarL/FixJ family response regulator [Roseateles asaccharophilus]